MVLERERNLIFLFLDHRMNIISYNDLKIEPNIIGRFYL